MSIATTIMISSLPKDSSGGFVRSIRKNDCENHIQDTNLVSVKDFQRTLFENLEVNMFYFKSGFILKESIGENVLQKIWSCFCY